MIASWWSGASVCLLSDQSTVLDNSVVTCDFLRFDMTTKNGASKSSVVFAASFLFALLIAGQFAFSRAGHSAPVLIWCPNNQSDIVSRHSSTLRQIRYRNCLRRTSSRLYTSLAKLLICLSYPMSCASKISRTTRLVSMPTRKLFSFSKDLFLSAIFFLYLLQFSPFFLYPLTFRYLSAFSFSV